MTERKILDLGKPEVFSLSVLFIIILVTLILILTETKTLEDEVKLLKNENELFRLREHLNLFEKDRIAKQNNITVKYQQTNSNDWVRTEYDGNGQTSQFIGKITNYSYSYYIN